MAHLLDRTDNGAKIVSLSTRSAAGDIGSRQAIAIPISASLMAGASFTVSGHGHYLLLPESSYYA